MSRPGTAHSPTQLQTLLLRAALLPAAPATEAWQRVKGQVADPELLDRPTYRLLPKLYLNLAGAGATDPVLERIKGIYRYAWYRNQALFHESAGMLRALHAAGVETMLVKGASMSVRYYRDEGARPMSDLDVLVRPSDVPRAAEVFGDHGWNQPEGDRRPFATVARFRHATPYQSPSGNAIDLHWAPLYEPLDVDGLWDAAVPARLAGVDTRALSPADELLVACAHGLGRAEAPVRWIADAVVLIGAARDELDWDRLVAQAERFHLTARLEPALRILRTQFATPVPSAILDRLARVRRPAFERLSQRVIAHPPPRFDVMFSHWSRYRRLRALDPRAAGPSFPHYVRDHYGESSFHALLRRGLRGEGDSVLERPTPAGGPTEPVPRW